MTDQPTTTPQANTEGDCSPDVFAPDERTTHPGAPTPPETGAKVHPGTPAREGAGHPGAEPDTSGEQSEGVDDDERTNPTPQPVTQSAPQRAARAAQEFADRWGLDVRPPSFARQGLPPLNDSRRYAHKGQQAPVVGPARVGARVWDATTRPVRWLLRMVDHLLARLGRTVVAFAVLALALRIDVIRAALAALGAVIDFLTFYTGLQWLLGLI